MVEVLFKAFSPIIRYEAGGILIFCHVNYMFVENFETLFSSDEIVLFFFKAYSIIFLYAVMQQYTMEKILNSHPLFKAKIFFNSPHLVCRFEG